MACTLHCCTLASLTCKYQIIIYLLLFIMLLPPCILDPGQPCNGATVQGCRGSRRPATRVGWYQPLPGISRSRPGPVKSLGDFKKRYPIISSSKSRPTFRGQKC